jgi:peptide/nickel transport system ATP-binding protein
VTHPADPGAPDPTRALGGDEDGGAPGDRVLSVRGLTVRTADVELVHPVDLDIARGERVGLIGESGSGKTLTALAVMGLLPEGLEASGRVRVRGVRENLLELPERTLSRLRGSRMGMVFQEPLTALNPTMRVGRQVAEVLLLHRDRAARVGQGEVLGEAGQPGRDEGAPDPGRTDRAAIRAEVIRLLDDVRLPDPEQAARSYPHQLSGGQRQRVVLAMALANSPDLLICDEPTTALDVTVQANVLDLIVAGVEARDAGLLFISHDLAVIATVCERVAVMYDGRIVESGPVRQVLTQPTHAYTRKLLAASSLAGIEARGRQTQEARSVARGSAAEPDAPVIEVRGVTRDYKRPRRNLFGPAPIVHALRGVDLTIRRGERVGIVGESGCGKSTLLRILAGLDQPTTGEVRVAGRPVSGQPERRLGFLRQSLQMVFQDPMGSLDPRMRIHASVREPLLLLGRDDHRERVARLLTSVGIDPENAHRYPHQFSGGQRQRISIARAIGPEPDILLADEPVSALDVSVRAQVLGVLADLVDDLELTLVFVSHDLSVVRAVCDRVVVMKAGLIVEEGPVAQVYGEPTEPYTRRLVASIPTIERALAGVSAADLAAARAQEHPGEA